MIIIAPLLSIYVIFSIISLVCVDFFHSGGRWCFLGEFVEVCFSHSGPVSL